MEGDWRLGDVRGIEGIRWKGGIHQILPNPLLPKPLKYSSTKRGLRIIAAVLCKLQESSTPDPGPSRQLTLSAPRGRDQDASMLHLRLRTVVTDGCVKL